MFNYNARVKFDLIFFTDQFFKNDRQGNSSDYSCIPHITPQLMFAIKKTAVKKRIESRTSNTVKSSQI